MLGDMNKAKELWRGSQDLGLNFMALRNRPNVNESGQGVSQGSKERASAFYSVLTQKPPCRGTSRSACPGENE